MKSLFDESDRRDILARLAALTSASPRLWGKMTPPQMLAHCSLGLECAVGDRPMKQKLLGKILTPLIRGQIFGEKPFSKSAPTDPTFIVSDDRDFEKERTRLVALVERVVAQGKEAAGRNVHAFFGRLTGEEWGILMWKHIDHHLRQFGR